MYYVIKKQHGTPQKCFIGFKVPKYIASKNNDSVIFEFSLDGKVQRKWVKKEDIILLTDDKAFFTKTMNQFKNVEATQQKLIDDARDQLDKCIETFTETMNASIDEFNEIKNSDDIPNILKDF